MRLVALAHETPVAFPSAARLPRGVDGNVARLDGEASVEVACRAGGA